MSSRISLALMFLASVYFESLALAQTVSDVPPITIRSNTRLVTVDVVVTSKKGVPVTGLKPDDFTVEENGKRQRISVFVTPGVANQTSNQKLPPGVLSNHPEAVERGPVTVLVLDAANSQFRAQSYARSQMLKYAAEHAQLEQRIAVFTLTDGLHVLQSFTSDPGVLLAAIGKIRPQEPPFKAANMPQVSPAVSALGPGVAESISSVMQEIRHFQSLQIEADQERRTLITVEAMRSLARILAGFPGRKNVLWLAGNLPFELIPQNRIPAEQARLHTQEIRGAEAQLAAAGVAIYPVDIRGLMGRDEIADMPSTPKSDMLGTRDIHELTNPTLESSPGMSNFVASQETMREIAAETGGRAYVNLNEIKDSVDLAVADGKVSYSLGYYPENKTWDGKYRNIKIRVSQSDTVVRHRRGYFALDTAQQRSSDENEIAAALTLDIPATQVLFMAQAKPTNPGKMRVIFWVDAHTVSAEDSDGGKKLNVSMYASIYDQHGKNLGTRSTKVDRAFDAATYQQILANGVMVPIDMDVPAGGQELRLAVLDNKTGFIGTANGPLGQ